MAGIQAALDIADGGCEVVLVEREPSIGGKMAGLSETFPTLDCSQCILTPRMVEVAQHPNIRLLAYSEVESIRGYVGNFQATIRRKARYVDIDKCTGCGLCSTACPVKKNPSAFDYGLGTRHGDLHPLSAGGARPAGDRPKCLHPPDEGEVRRLLAECQAGAINYDDQDSLSQSVRDCRRQEGRRRGRMRRRPPATSSSSIGITWTSSRHSIGTVPGESATASTATAAGPT